MTDQAIFTGTVTMFIYSLQDCIHSRLVNLSRTFRWDQWFHEDFKLLHMEKEKEPKRATSYLLEGNI